MKLEVGMYVRTDNGMKLGKVIKIHNLKTKTWYELDTKIRVDNSQLTKKKIKNNIIDLIEVGDYVNGLLVTRICEDNETKKKFINLYGSISEWEEEDIKSIVTKEMYSSVEYRVETD